MTTAALLGLPFDAASSFRRGAALGPDALRSALHCPSTNLCTESGLDLGADTRWEDLGDLASFDAIEPSVADLLAHAVRPLAIGGDHAVTLPLLRAAAARFGPVDVLHLDAHPDLYDEFDGNRLSHACPFARAWEEGLIERHVQIGIRTMNPHQGEQANRFGVEVIDMRAWPGASLPVFTSPAWLTIDLDCLDPAFAPGVSHPEPGGLTTREVLGIIQRLDAPLVGADLVELNPTFDHPREPAGLTAMVAAKIATEILARLIEE